MILKNGVSIVFNTVGNWDLEIVIGEFGIWNLDSRTQRQEPLGTPAGNHWEPRGGNHWEPSTGNAGNPTGIREPHRHPPASTRGIPAFYNESCREHFPEIRGRGSKGSEIRTPRRLSRCWGKTKQKQHKPKTQPKHTQNSLKHVKIYKKMIIVGPNA